ncbi:hypothetical protein GOP47_0011810 [Adiantum capillus-veneris]|uniref:FCP1 homology domain-containing protein n=1 Tax=Adiantum capillus-veneris TaxID=13818 RepID=A0A9D4UUU1_ADICA|nr:hypothetical protein GOP47_0011810 [Adiantum capillus-veneris]
MGKSIAEAQERSAAGGGGGGATSSINGGNGGAFYYAGGGQERLSLRPPSLMKVPCRKRQRSFAGSYSSLINSNGATSAFFNSLAITPSAAKCASARLKGPLLPPLSPEHEGRKTLVLDLDETLVHSSFKPITEFDFAIQVEMEVETSRMGLQTVFVLKRPGVEAFLRAMASLFEVIVFTAGLKQYADAVLDNIDIDNCIKHRLYRDSCKFHMGGLVKDLSTLGRDLRKVIIVDNSPHCYLLQPRNAVPIVSFIDNRDDRELLDLIPFLSVISELDNVTQALGQV